MAYSPQQNGKAERMNRTLVERARTILIESGLDRIYWSEALLCATFVTNRCPTVGGLIPYSEWHNRNFDYSKLKVFGCDAYRLRYKHSADKMVNKSDKLKFVGYAPGGYRLLDLTNNKIHLSRDVKFNELSVISDNSDNSNVILNEVNNDNVADISDFCFLANSNVTEDIPSSLSEAMKTTNAHEWFQAVQREQEALISNETWELISRPIGCSTVSSRWVFTVKKNNVNENVFKARLVARGFEQCKTFEYDEIYSPVAKLSTVRSILALCNRNKFFIHQLDVCNAFLNGHLNEPVYLEIPEGIYTNVNRNSHVLLLKKALYGLKQAPRAWNLEFNKFVISLGFTVSDADDCLYIYNSNDALVYLLLYVDDILICSTDLSKVNGLKRLISQKFKCRDLFEINNFLGLNVQYDRDNGVLKINQRNLINKIAKRFNVIDCKPVYTPIEEKLALSRCFDQTRKTWKPYRELVGCLMYVMLGSRPDICYSISYFSQFQDNGSDEHFSHLLRVLKYLVTTVNVNLTFVRSNSDSALDVYCDADWANY